MKLRTLYIILILYFCFTNFLSAQNDSITVILKYQTSKKIFFPILEEKKYSKNFFVENNKLIIEINTFCDTIIKGNNISIVSDYIMSRENFEFALLVPQKKYEINTKHIIIKFNNNRFYYFKKKNNTNNLFILKKMVKLSEL